MGRQSYSPSPCSVCSGEGQVSVLHTKKQCLFCNDEYHAVRLDNQHYFYSATFSNCPFCKSVCVIESMETIIVTCPLCLGRGTRTWVDKMIRPYNKSRMERDLIRLVSG